MRKQFLLSIIGLCFIFISASSQSLSLIQSNSHTGHLASLVKAKVIKLTKSNSTGYAAAITLGNSGVLSYCTNSLQFYIPYRTQALALFNENLDLLSVQSPAFSDGFSYRPQLPMGEQYFGRNSVAHDVVQLRRGGLVVSGALEIFTHDPTPNRSCNSSFFSSKLFVYQTDISGTIYWAFGFDIPVTKSKVIELQNGTLLVIANDSQNNLYYLLLNSRGKFISCKVFDKINFSLVLEQKETSGNILVVGSSESYVTPYSTGYRDVVCLNFNPRSNLLRSVTLGRQLNDAPGAIQYNPYTNNYFLVFNSEAKNNSPAGTINNDIIGIDLDDQLRMTSMVAWGDSTDETAFDILIDSTDKNKAITLFGVVNGNSPNFGSNTHNFLLQENPNGVRQFSFIKPISYSLFFNDYGTPLSNTFRAFISFPNIPTSFNLFKTSNNEYLLNNPSFGNPPPGSTTLNNWMVSKMQWMQTDLQLDRGYCAGDPLALPRFNADIANTNFSPSWTERFVNAYPLRTNQSFIGSIFEEVECGNKELIGNKELMNNPVKSIRAVSSPASTISSISKATVYPNPAADIITVRISENSFSGPVSIRIADELGRIVYTKTFPFIKAGKIDLSVRSLKTGSYYLQANANGNVFSGKFVKQAP